MGDSLQHIVFKRITGKARILFVFGIQSVGNVVLHSRGLLVGILFFLFLFGIRFSFAQSIPIPNPNWPLDSVVNTSVHKYTVHGDINYVNPSWFVWNVSGGSFFYDSLETQPALYGNTDTVRGDANNITSMWVKWELLNGALDTGYVYLHEISYNNCQLPDEYEVKYPGMRIKVSAPPDVWFLFPETNVCAYEDSFYVEIGIDGMPPFDLTYSVTTIDGTTEHEWHIEQEDLIDSDGDGELNNVLIVRNNFTGTTDDIFYRFELLNASSGGVIGTIRDDYYFHSVFVFAQPPAPEILRNWQQVTINVPHDYSLIEPGVAPIEWYWELIDINEIAVFMDTTATPMVTVPFNVVPGDYGLIAYYLSENGCYSFADTMDITVFDLPEISFVGDSIAKGCSWSSVVPQDTFYFDIHYEGALSYSFTCQIMRYDEISGQWTGTTMWNDINVYGETNRDVQIKIPNFFENYFLPEKDRVWKVFISNAENEEKIGITIPDTEIDWGGDERRMIIHPKPIITEGIDFEN